MKTNKRIAVVKFQGTNRGYDFFNPFTELEVGDSVLCDTAVGMSVGKITGFKSNSTVATKFIVQPVHLQEFEANKKKMQDRQRLWNQIQARINQIDEEEKVQYLSLHDARLSVLYNSYKKLSKELGC